jgi:hypothetical protein
MLNNKNYLLMKKINLENKDKVNKAIDAAEHRCTARLLSYDELLSVVRDAENILREMRIPQRRWRGVYIDFHPENVAKAYKYPAEGTAARVERFASGWFLTDVYRGNCSTDKKPYDMYIPIEVKMGVPDNIKL